MTSSANGGFKAADLGQKQCAAWAAGLRGEKGGGRRVHGGMGGTPPQCHLVACGGIDQSVTGILPPSHLHMGG